MPRTAYHDAFSNGPRASQTTPLGAEQGQAYIPPGQNLKWMKPLPDGATSQAPTGFRPSDAQKYLEHEGEELDVIYYEEMDTSLGRGFWWPLMDKLYQAVYRSQFPINMWLLEMRKLQMEQDDQDPTPFAVTDLASRMIADAWPEQTKAEKVWRYGDEAQIVGDGTVHEDAMATASLMTMYSYRCAAGEFKIATLIGWIQQAAFDIDRLATLLCFGTKGLEYGRGDFPGEENFDKIWSQDSYARSHRSSDWLGNLYTALVNAFKPCGSRCAREVFPQRKRPRSPKGSYPLTAGFLADRIRHGRHFPRWAQEKVESATDGDQRTVFKIFTDLCNIIREHPLAQAYRWPAENTTRRDDKKTHWGEGSNQYRVRTDTTMGGSNAYFWNRAQDGVIISPAKVYRGNEDFHDESGALRISGIPEERTFAFLWKYMDDMVPRPCHPNEMDKRLAEQGKWFANQDDETVLKLLRWSVQQLIKTADESAYRAQSPWQTIMWETKFIMEDIGLFPVRTRGYPEMDIMHLAKTRGHQNEIWFKKDENPLTRWAAFLNRVLQMEPQQRKASWDRWLVGVGRRLRGRDGSTPKARTEQDVARWVEQLQVRVHEFTGETLPEELAGADKRLPRLPDSDDDSDEDEGAKRPKEIDLTVSNDPQPKPAHEQPGKKPNANVAPHKPVEAIRVLAKKPPLGGLGVPGSKPGKDHGGTRDKEAEVALANGSGRGSVQGLVRVPAEANNKRKREDGDTEQKTAPASDSSGKRPKPASKPGADDEVMIYHPDGQEHLPLVNNIHPQARDTGPEVEVVKAVTADLVKQQQAGTLPWKGDLTEMGHELAQEVMKKMQEMYTQSSTGGRSMAGAPQKINVPGGGTAFQASGYLSTASGPDTWLMVFAYSPSHMGGEHSGDTIVYGTHIARDASGRMVSKTKSVAGKRIEAGEYIYIPYAPNPIPANIVAHSIAPNLRPPRSVVQASIRSGQTQVQAAVQMAVAMARQDAFARSQDSMELVPYEQRAVTQGQMLTVAQQLNDQGVLVTDMMHENRMELYKQMQMQQHFGRQNRDAQNGIMQGIMGFVASMQKESSSAMATLMGQAAGASMQVALRAQQAAKHVSDTVVHLGREHRAAAHNMANQLGRQADQAHDTARAAINALVNQNKSNEPVRINRDPSKFVGPSRPEHLTQPGRGRTTTRERIVETVTADAGGGAGILITAVATIGLLALAIGGS